MEIYSDKPEDDRGAPPAAPVEHRVRWGNVALALAALAAVAAAVLLPNGQPAAPQSRVAALPSTAVTAPAGPTPRSPGPSRRTGRSRSHSHSKRRHHARKQQARRPAATAPHAAAAPPQPQAPIQSDPVPAAEREFGL